MRPFIILGLMALTLAGTAIAADPKPLNKLTKEELLVLAAAQKVELAQKAVAIGDYQSEVDIFRKLGAWAITLIGHSLFGNMSAQFQQSLQMRPTYSSSFGSTSDYSSDSYSEYCDGSDDTSTRPQVFPRMRPGPVGQPQVQIIAVPAPVQNDSLAFARALGVLADDVGRLKAELENARQHSTNLQNRINVLEAEKVSLQKQIDLGIEQLGDYDRIISDLMALPAVRALPANQKPSHNYDDYMGKDADPHPPQPTSPPQPAAPSQKGGGGTGPTMPSMK